MEEINDIRINQKVNYETLEEILINSAKELGLKLEVEYKSLGEFPGAHGKNETNKYVYSKLKERNSEVFLTTFHREDSTNFFMSCQYLSSELRNKLVDKISSYFGATSKELYK
jgi:hypothetical protein